MREVAGISSTQRMWKLNKPLDWSHPSPVTMLTEKVPVLEEFVTAFGKTHHVANL